MPKRRAKLPGGKPLSDAAAAAIVDRERTGKKALRDRSIFIGFGDGMTPEEFRSIYRIAEFARKNAPPSEFMAMVDGLVWLGMVFDAGAGMLPRKGNTK